MAKQNTGDAGALRMGFHAGASMPLSSWSPNLQIWIILLKYQTLPNLKVWTPRLNLMAVTQARWEPENVCDAKALKSISRLKAKVC